MKKIALIFATVLLLVLVTNAEGLRIGGGITKFFNQGFEGINYAYGLTTSYSLNPKMGFRGNWYIASVNSLNNGQNIRGSVGIITIEGCAQLPLSINAQMFAGLGLGRNFIAVDKLTLNKTMLSVSTGIDLQLVPKVWLTLGGNLLYNRHESVSYYSIFTNLSYAF